MMFNYAETRSSSATRKLRAKLALDLEFDSLVRRRLRRRFHRAGDGRIERRDE